MAIILRRRKLGRASCRAFKELTGIPVVRNWRQKEVDQIGSDDLVIRWGCTAAVPSRNVVNTARAIHQVNDKLEFRRLLNEHNLCPRTWFKLSDWILESDMYPDVLFRPANHSRGRNILKYSIQEEHDGSMAADGFIRRFPNYYISEYVPKVAEYRVCVLAGRVVWVAKKTPDNPDAIAWNVARGGRFDNVRWGEWPLRAVRVAVEAFNLSSLDFGGVDVMVDAGGRAYVLEINSAPSHPFNSDGSHSYRQECMAKALTYLINNGKERIPLIEERGGYRKFIHPAVDPNAKLVGV